MKKVIITLLSVACLLAILAIPAFADSSTTVLADFSKYYEKNFFTYVLTGRYYTAHETVPVNAASWISVSNDQFGQSKVTLTALNNEVGVSQTQGYPYGYECNNSISSGFGYVIGQSYAKEVVHYGFRATNSGDIVQFTATCE